MSVDKFKDHLFIIFAYAGWTILLSFGAALSYGLWHLVLK